MDSNSTGLLTAKIIGGLILWAIVFALGFALTTYAAFVLRTMWEWFIVPSGFEPMTKPFSIGLLLIIGLLKAKIDTDNDDTKASDTPAYMRAIVACVGMAFFITLSWGSAAIWHFYLL